MSSGFPRLGIFEKLYNVVVPVHSGARRYGGTTNNLPMPIVANVKMVPNGTGMIRLALIYMSVMIGLQVRYSIAAGYRRLYDKK